ncbi:MAG TPA: polysaccharide biosynthesis/export family protein, partial [Methylomirabilota bacterium]|nr:polysaccharide biosynthesis/export family protein [Methylomirabilota bacterium]
LAYLEQVVASRSYGPALKRRAEEESRAIQQRLRRGDFQVGDRVFLLVEAESVLTDTFTVTDGPRLQLPIVGSLSLSGVLRAELEPHVADHLQRFLREPRVTARSLVRITVDGAVARPGFVTVPSETILADVLAAAGGASSSAQLDRIVVSRNNQPLLSRGEIDLALREGRTIDQLGLQAGDRVIVPERGEGLGGFESSIRTVSYLLSIPLTIFAITQIF